MGGREDGEDGGLEDGGGGSEIKPRTYQVCLDDGYWNSIYALQSTDQTYCLAL